MSDDMIEMSDEVEGIIRAMDDVAKDFPPESASVRGQSGGVASEYVRGIESSRKAFRGHFLEASQGLRKVVNIMNEAAADQRKVESEIVDMLKRLEQDAEAPATPQTPGTASPRPGSAKKPTPLSGKQ